MSHDAFEPALTPYDEFPVHQAPYPVSYVPQSDMAWDSGYYFGVYHADKGLFLITGMRINPNTGMAGAHCSINRQGMQRTLRLSRVWHGDYSVAIGPLKYDFVEPLRKIRLTLDRNDSGLSFDVMWDGASPPQLSSHHRAWSNGRRTTDQTRYNQVGRPTGWVEVDGERHPITPDNWGACRDRSWGIYESRPPVATAAKWLPPREQTGLRRAMRFSCFFETGEFCGHFHFHEGENGEKEGLNDAFGTPFEGRIDYGWSGRGVKLVSADHKIEWRPGTRSMASAKIKLGDENGRAWTLEIDVPHMPHVLGQVGYHVGAWHDGGTIHTYHGPGIVSEWDEFDFREQPAMHTFPGNGETRNVFGVEHVANLRFTDPDGKISTGRGQIEIFLNGRYTPYGFEEQNDSGGLTGRGIA
jgi:hypothetical protein